eukprot:5901693-Prymnesium_polylepis.1
MPGVGLSVRIVFFFFFLARNTHTSNYNDARGGLSERQRCWSLNDTSPGHAAKRFHATRRRRSAYDGAIAGAGATPATAGAHRLRAGARRGGASSCAPLSRPTKFLKFWRRALLLLLRVRLLGRRGSAPWGQVVQHTVSRRAAPKVVSLGGVVRSSDSR